MRYPAAAAYSTAAAVPTPKPAVPKPTAGMVHPLDSCTCWKGVGVCRALQLLQLALQAMSMKSTFLLHSPAAAQAPQRSCTCERLKDGGDTLQGGRQHVQVYWKVHALQDCHVCCWDSDKCTVNPQGHQELFSCKPFAQCSLWHSQML